jgi:hypothetical protein
MINNGPSLSWVVPCDQDLALSVNIGGSTYRMKKEQLISSDSTGTVCTSLVKGWSDPGVRAYVFGTPFASIAYIAYNAYKDQTSDQIGLAPRSTEPTSHGVSKTLLIAAIVGSVLLTVFIISAIVFVFYHKRRGTDTHDSNPTVEGKYAVEPFTGGAPNSATPILPTTVGSGRYIIEQGPIGGDPSEGDASRRQSQFTDFTPTSSSSRTPLSPDSKRARSSSHPHSMRQSQFIDVPTFSPIPETTELHAVRPSPSLDQHQPRVSSFHEPQPQLHLAPDEPAPPPYQPPERNVPTGKRIEVTVRPRFATALDEQ